MPRCHVFFMPCCSVEEYCLVNAAFAEDDDLVLVDHDAPTLVEKEDSSPGWEGIVLRNLKAVNEALAPVYEDMLRAETANQVSMGLKDIGELQESERQPEELAVDRHPACQETHLGSCVPSLAGEDNRPQALACGCVSDGAAEAEAEDTDMEFAWGCRVRALTIISYRSEQVPAGAVGTLVAMEPTMRVNWGASGPNMGVVRPDQVTPEREVPAPSEFRASLAKSHVDGRLGLHFDLLHGSVLHVCRISAGGNSATSYNARVQEELQLRPGDFITELNGIRGDSKAMMSAAKTSTVLDVLVSRPILFVAQICRRRGYLGLGLKHVTNARSLLIESVLDGPVLAWNRENPGLEVKPGDYIVAVNGTSGATCELFTALAHDGALALLISRPNGS